MRRVLNRLSSRTVATLSKPGRYADGGRLYLKIGRDGGKRWTFMYERNGKQREMGLGPVSDVSLARARERAAVYRAQLAEDIDPLDAQRAARAAPTFATVADEVLVAATARSKNEKHRYQWERALKVEAAALRPLPVDKITTDDVLAVLRPVWDEKPETASRLRGRIERVLDAASAKGLRNRENPARWKGHLANLLPARKKLTRGHHKALPFQELSAFVSALRARPAEAARALEFLILSAARMAEVLGATWSEIDIDSRVWTVPAARMKAGKEHRVPLSETAVEILRQQRALRPNDRATDLVFQGPRHGAPLSNMACSALLKRMGVEVTSHGFRSTFRDWAGEATDFPREVAEAALAHQVGDEVERAYRRGDALEKRRKMMAAWADFCAGGPAAARERT